MFVRPNSLLSQFLVTSPPLLPARRCTTSITHSKVYTSSISSISALVSAGANSSHNSCSSGSKSSSSNSSSRRNSSRKGIGGLIISWSFQCSPVSDVYPQSRRRTLFGQACRYLFYSRNTAANRQVAIFLT
eukprot:GHVS01005473.1.p1 GENE.GHVS01005473.1~~GHVS01005473.1.p1  ORF type:complete len:131 (+),score=18.38 GHVS01005473.1:171-563(+)